MKPMALKGILTAMAIVMILCAEVSPLHAAGKNVEKSTRKNVTQIPETAPKENLAGTSGQNVEKLLSTLNETLQENRRIRESMRDLQSSFEKATMEKIDAAERVKKAEQLVIQRNMEAGRQISELSAQLENTKKEMKKIKAGSGVSTEQKTEMEKKLEGIKSENLKLQELLKSSILTAERDQILEQMKKNDEAVQNAVAQVSSVDQENIALKTQLVQSYFDLGNLFYDLGRYEDAEIQYRHVLKWDPYHTWSHHNLAIIYDFHLHKIAEAIAHYQKYLLLKLPSEEAEKARMRLWDLTQLTKVTPRSPLKKEFDEHQKI